MKGGTNAKLIQHKLEAEDFLTAIRAICGANGSQGVLVIHFNQWNHAVPQNSLKRL